MTKSFSEIGEKIKALDGPIVVFGAGGFFGANLIRKLLEHRSDVYGVTHQPYIPWRLSGLPVSNILRCDITKPAETQRLFNEHPFKVLFCLAAYGGYARQTDPHTILETNTMGVLNILNAARAKGFSAFIQAGSSSEYGLNSAGPSESDLLAPNSYYSVSKISAAYLLAFAAHAYGLPVINLRYYSLYGPWEESDRLVPTLVRCAQKGQWPPLVEPDISRDFVYIADAVKAAVLAASVGVREKPGASLNIATGSKTTIREVANQIKELFKLASAPQWGTMPNRSWDQRDWYGNPTLAKEVLGWQAETSLSDGLRLTREWFEQRPAHAEISELAQVSGPPRLSAVVACYNDAQAIPIMHERLTAVFQQLKADYEIIFVNDGSPDESDGVLRDLTHRDDHVIAIEHARNFGSQNAFISGMRLVTGDAVILLDGDLQDPPELISALYDQWRAGYDVVYGKRARRQMNWFNNLCTKSFYRLFRMISYVPIPLDAGDFSLMSRQVVEELLALPESDQFLRGLRAWVGFRQVGVEYVRPQRKFGRSTNNLRRNLWWARKAIFSFSFIPLELMMYGGLTLTAISFILMVAQVIGKLLRPNIPHGITTIIVLILFFGGVQMLTISVLGEYLSKVFEESKRRPLYVRKAVRFAGRHLTTAEAMEDFVRSRARAKPS